MTNIKAFAALNNLKKLNQAYADHVKRDYQWSTKHVQAEFTHFASTHAVGYGLNGSTRTVDFQSQLIEADQVYIDRGYQNGEYISIDVYLKATGSDFQSRKQIFIELKDAKGKSHRRTRVDVDTLRVLFGYQPIEVPKDVEAVKQDGNVLKLVDHVDTYHERVESFYDGLCNDFKYTRERFEEFLTTRGWKLARAFEFTHSFTFKPEFIVETTNAIEFGWYTYGTYCSHPNTLKLTKVAAVKTVNLNDIGVEKSGYYDHHVNLHIRPEQVKAVKVFNRQFQRKLKK